MLKSVEGVYGKGRIGPAQVPVSVKDDTRVIVTFLESGEIDLRVRLTSLAEDWESPEMSIYDNC